MKPRKLTLKRTTIRQLTVREQSEVLGGSANITCPCRTTEGLCMDTAYCPSWYMGGGCTADAQAGQTDTSDVYTKRYCPVLTA